MLSLNLFVEARQIWWGANYYADRLPPASGWLVWDKDNSGHFADVELAWTNIKSPARLFRHRWNGMLRASEKGRRIHPTQKPEILMSWCLEQLSKPGTPGLVVDPFAGCAPIASAAKKRGIKSISIEIVEAYCEKAADRLSQEVLTF